tara:strand:+ start:152 stop:577 length:426 start_codon:yes stop_codon:yes gene_type:complete
MEDTQALAKALMANPSSAGMASLTRTGPAADGAFMPAQYYGNRYESADPKQAGYFGELARPDGGVSTELSFDFDNNGQNVQAPLLTPNLNAAQISELLSLQDGQRPSQGIYDAAQAHAMKRGMAGMNPFWTPGEQFTQVPK